MALDPKDRTVVVGRPAPRSLPGAPTHWDPSSKEAWHQLIRILEATPIINSSRRALPQFIVKGTVSAATTVDLLVPEVTALAHIVSKLIIALNLTNLLDVRTTVA